jgi:hypothetical protein
MSIGPFQLLMLAVFFGVPLFTLLHFVFFAQREKPKPQPATSDRDRTQ